MEFYSYPSLDDCFVYAKADLDTWEKIFAKIFHIISTASKYSVNDKGIKSDLENMYYHKTIERLKQFSEENPRLCAAADYFKVSDKSLIPLSEALKSLNSLLKQFKVYDTDRLQVIHGDLCFNNILYDNKHGIMKLIDPRGQFGRYAIYGDVYYDLAKISHSVLGLYDLIMFGQFKISGNENQEIFWLTSPYQTMLGQIFKKHLQKAGFDIARTRFIEALLFLSMLPLHKDKPNRQRAMLVRGLSILTGLLEEQQR
jgi:thiamine kinase-like enzyme